MKTIAPPLAVYLPAEARAGLRNRLRRLNGQVGGIERMLEDENKTCDEILIQVAALREAVGSMAAAILRAHVETCETACTDPEARRSLDTLKGTLTRVLRHA